LLSRGFQAWPLLKVLERHRRREAFPPGVFVVTFDDAYGNVYLNAFPILRELNVPATAFLATAYLDCDKPFPSDDWLVAGLPGVPAEAWRPLRTDECLEMQASGLVEMACHTHTHADFRGRPNELRADLERNRKVLHDKFGVEQPTFAFPYGTKCDGFASDMLSEAARQAGMLCALTTEAQLVRPQDDPFDWGRFAAEDHDTSATLAAKLTGWHTAVRSLGLTLLGRRRKQTNPSQAGTAS
jgi:peptidoglycan/xylan/chitin deacetylase (PgdA/CDA1 family)